MCSKRREDDATSTPTGHRSRNRPRRRKNGTYQENIRPQLGPTGITPVIHQTEHQQHVKTTPGPPRGVMVPLVLLVHPEPPWSTLSVKFEKLWIRADQSGPGGPQGPQPPLVDQGRSGPPWTTLRHFPDATKIKDGSQG